jgi:LDH2 family malate/lactate/ureidoglycolate dehydrogenase
LHPGQHQGLEKLLRYSRRARNGGIVAAAAMRWERQTSATALLDAAKGFGYVAAHRAMQRAIDKARQHGVACVGVRNSNHFGIAGFHARLAAQQGLIGIAQTNAGAEMAPWGSAQPVLGTNPWGIAIPRLAGKDPIILDMALTQSGKGMMRWYERAGLSIPDNWGLTVEGDRTTDPHQAMRGPLLPMGDYKGYGLSLITDVLCGVMTGALFGLSVFQDDQSYDVGHTMIAIDPQAFLPGEEFGERLEQLIAEVADAPAIDAQHPVMLPGEEEQRRARRRLREGIPIDVESVTQLNDLAAELGIDCPL